MRTLDEEIEYAREKARKHKEKAEKQEQRAEWLEELKMLQELKGFNEGYEKAIDDFLGKIQWEYLNSCGIKQKEIEFLINVSSDVAEQLKAGGENDSI